MNRPTYGDPDGPWIKRENAGRSPRGVQRRAKSRNLRQKMSLPEVLLWQKLRRGATGWRFRRQHAIGPYVADFYCHEARLVLEVDGECHIDRRAGDIERDRWLAEHGYVVNEDIRRARAQEPERGRAVHCGMDGGTVRAAGR